MIERTLILVKPDGVRRGLVGEVISRFERKGFRIVGLKMLKLSRQKAEELYEPHRGREFFEGLIRFMTSGPIVPQAQLRPNPERFGVISRLTPGKMSFMHPIRPEAPKGSWR